MHPIERLRFVARDAGDLPVDQLAAQAAVGLAEVAEDDPAALVVCARQLLTRHPEAGPLWWICSRLLGAEDLWSEAMACVDDLAAQGSAAPQPRVRSTGGAVEAMAACGGWALLRDRGGTSAGGILRIGPGVIVPTEAWVQILSLLGRERAPERGGGELVHGGRASFDEAEVRSFSHHEIGGSTVGDLAELPAAGWSVPGELRGLAIASCEE